MGPTAVISHEEAEQIFDMHEEAPTMSYRYEVARALARHACERLTGASRIGLSDDEVDGIFDPLQGEETAHFRAGVARAVEALVRTKVRAQ